MIYGNGQLWVTGRGWVIAGGCSRFLCPIPATCWWLITLLAPQAKRLQLHLASLRGSLSQSDTHSDTRRYYMNCSQPSSHMYQWFLHRQRGCEEKKEKKIYSISKWRWKGAQCKMKDCYSLFLFLYCSEGTLLGYKGYNLVIFRLYIFFSPRSIHEKNTIAPI